MSIDVEWKRQPKQFRTLSIRGVGFIAQERDKAGSRMTKLAYVKRKRQFRIPFQFSFVPFLGYPGGLRHSVRCINANRQLPIPAIR